ncbi:MAG: ribbon-helix-helix domain-containing protein [Thermodesulfovibrionia bacterium]|nr:ribbon-helix-helix domain-containing protein [Thermodesulfovibrionia bacterium]
MVKKSSTATGVSTANKVFGVRMDQELAKKLKILAIKKNTQVYKLLEDAITDYLKKHKEL